MGLYLRRAAGGFAGQPDSAGAGLCRDRHARGEDHDGLFQLRLRLDAALEAGDGSTGALQRRGFGAGGFTLGRDQIRHDGGGRVVQLHRRGGTEARRLVRGRAQHPGAAEAHRRIRPRRAQHLDGRSPLEADLRPAREHVQRGKDHLKRYAQRRGEYSRKPYAALKSPRFSFKVTKISQPAC